MKRGHAVTPIETQASDVATVSLHSASLGTIIATFLGWLPIVIGLVPAVYYAILILESKTVQGWLLHRRQRKATKKIIKLTAKSKIILAELEAMEAVRIAKSAADEKVAVATHDAAKLVASAETATKAEQITNSTKK